MNEDDLNYLLRDLISKEQENTKTLFFTCLRSFTLVLFCDMVTSFDHYAYTHDWFYTQMVSGAISQLGWLGASFLFFNAQNNKERLCIGVSECLASSVGSSLMLGWIKPWYVLILKEYM